MVIMLLLFNNDISEHKLLKRVANEVSSTVDNMIKEK